MPLSPSVDEQQRWLALARDSIAERWQGPRPAPELTLGNQVVDAFVSLHIDSRLRGCIGATDAERPLKELIPRLARRCAFNDPRFPALEVDELPRCQLEITLLGPKRPLPAQSRAALLAALEPGQGLLLCQGERQALFLPQVWQSLEDKGRFLDALLHKGGWSTWPDGMAAYTFDALVVQDGLGGPESHP
ncbi:AmmeMemoRadiSam system protein A [Ferrimonas balearica]|uniref:AmmeMemoRadiSam system protein A n=1 Tax=Ferrimonas balearica TaxID=44012 RepID=UPI001C997A48|nr:AmmeMemoRadiSam system protein A [Ferrimonas balearica]MBY5992599.1 AmmeMemoRadiSam system protein A [Ferrimonas balearica]